MKFKIKCFAEGSDVFPIDFRIVDYLGEYLEEKFNTKKVDIFDADWIYELHVFYETDMDDIYSLPSNEFKKDKAKTFIYLVPLNFLDYNKSARAFVDLIKMLVETFLQENFSNRSLNENLFDELDFDFIDSFSFPAEIQNVKYFKA